VHGASAARERTRGSGASDKELNLAPIFRPPPEPIALSSPIIDRQSTFQGRIYRITSSKDAEFILANLSSDADHNMAAWRTLSLKPGRSGLAGPDDFKLESASKDDGEQWGGKRILGIMEKEGVSDALVVVSRW
jgi:putative IMPACT (imprinted ancient) family translation regulator